MSDAKAIKFFQEILNKTRTARIRWEPTAEEAQFVAAIGGQFTVLTSAEDRRNTWGERYTVYSLVLRDEPGRSLIEVTSLDDGIQEAAARELYELSRRQALRVDNKIDQLLGELERL